MATVNVEFSGSGGAPQPSWGWSGVARQTLALAANCFLVPVSLGGVPGSGGAMTPEAALSRYQWHQDDSIVITAVTPGRDTEELTPAERLEQIRQALGLTITDLARLLDTSRPTVYAWLNGQEPKVEVQGRLLQLEQQAAAVAACELPRINKLIRRPLRCGATLLERLQSGESLTPALQELQALARREKTGRQYHKGLAASGRSSREALDDVGIPLERRG